MCIWTLRFWLHINSSSNDTNSSATDHEFPVEEISFVELDYIPMLALHQDVNLNAVVVELRLIADLNLFQRRSGTSHFVPRLHINQSRSLERQQQTIKSFNPSIPTLKPQSNGPLYSSTVIRTLAVDGWAVTFGTARRGLDGLGPRPVPSSLCQM